MKKSPKLIVLILFGVCLILLLICLFSIMSIKQKPLSAKVDVADTNTVIEKEDEKEADTQEDDFKEGDSSISYENVVDWSEDEIDFKTFDASSYEKETNKYCLIEEKSGYLVTFEIPTDFPFQMNDDYDRENPGSKVYLKNKDINVIFDIDLNYSSLAAIQNIDNETVDGVEYKTIQKVKLNNLAGTERYYRNYENFNRYSSTWILTKQEQASNRLLFNVYVDEMTGYREDYFDIEEFLKSDDYYYFLSSIKLYKNESEILNEVMGDIPEKEPTFVMTDPYEEIELFEADDFIDDNAEKITFDLESYGKESTSYTIEEIGKKYKLEFSVPTDLHVKRLESNATDACFFRSEGNSINMIVHIVRIDVPLDKYHDSELYMDKGYDYRKMRINKLSGWRMAYNVNERDHYYATWYLTDKDSEGKRIELSIEVNKIINAEENIDLNEFINSEDFKYLLASIKLYKNSKN